MAKSVLMVLHSVFNLNCFFAPPATSGIMEEIKKWNTDALELFVALLSTKESEVQNRIADVKSKLQTITTMIHDLSKQSQSGEDIGEIIERELSTMDKAIEEAASRIEVIFVLFCVLEIYEKPTTT